jgi:HK97 family phage prohead protease
MATQHLECNLIEVKLASPEEEGVEAGDMVFSGYGAVFGNLDSYGDVIQKGAFKETLKNAKKNDRWPALLMQHGGWAFTADDMTPIGIFTELEEDDVGLKFTAKLADITRAREAYNLMKMKPRPAITGMSIGYIAKKFTVGTKPDEPRRTLHQVELMEISLVTFPANDKARVEAVKSGWSVRDMERALRDVGLTQAEAKRFMAEGYKGLATRDVLDPDLKSMIERNISILKG